MPKEIKERKVKGERVKPVDPSKIYNTPEWWCRWFQRPTSLRDLMYLPNDTQLLDWVRAIAVHQDSLVADSLEKQAWYLGATFRSLIERTLELKWNVYCVFVILVYVSCIPEARHRLKPHDLAFVYDEFVPRYNHWIRGLRPDGSQITHSSQAQLALIPVLVHQLMDMYALGCLVTTI
jgi:hypothetical protein